MFHISELWGNTSSWPAHPSLSFCPSVYTSPVTTQAKSSQTLRRERWKDIYVVLYHSSLTLSIAGFPFTRAGSYWHILNEYHSYTLHIWEINSPREGKKYFPSSFNFWENTLSFTHCYVPICFFFLQIQDKWLKAKKWTALTENMMQSEKTLSMCILKLFARQFLRPFYTERVQKMKKWVQGEKTACVLLDKALTWGCSQIFSHSE